MKIPNSKLQLPEKLQNSITVAGCTLLDLELGAWNFSGAWTLVLET
jgi:hypothetical protein